MENQQKRSDVVSFGQRDWEVTKNELRGLGTGFAKLYTKLIGIISISDNTKRNIV